MSIVQRITKDAKNAFQDIYAHWLGDDAGKSAVLTYFHRNSEELPTFLEINGRAYVKSVVPGSAADRAGVLPKDAVQLAVVIGPEWIAENGNNSNNGNATGGAGDSKRLAARYALDLEKKGARSTYDQLRRLVLDNHVAGPSHFLSPAIVQDPSKLNDMSTTTWNGPPIPNTICATHCGATDEDQYYGFQRSSDASSAADDNNSEDWHQPIVFVLRRTRQRQAEGAAASTIMLPAAFRLDDECDLAVHLVRRLAPTADMQAPVPDTWEELVHDGTDWLLGDGSILPPKNPGTEVTEAGISPPNETIPWDEYEKKRALKLATLRSRMTAEAMAIDRTDDVEAATIRGMIQKAVGLAFVRASKIVLGVSLHGGSGIVIARLPDGTWSAPSAIGTWGLGLGLQFGLEVAEYIFILQTPEALQHFKRGQSYTVGGNMGLAVAGLGREAYGAASVSGGCGNTTSTVDLHDDEYNDDDDSRTRQKNRQTQSVEIAPIVAYAKSQGLYIGVSLEGSKIFTRDDINSRTYKFTSGRNVSADDILSGKVPTPPEAEELYAALHSVEFAHEMSCLPRPPEVLRRDSANAWHFDRSIISETVSSQTTLSSGESSGHQPFSFFSRMTSQERNECESFEAQFKNFMYGGVSVQRLIPDPDGRSGRTTKERRTLWLMLPEVGSLRLGFVSKLSDGDGGTVSNQSSTQRARRDDPSRLSSGFDGDLGTVGSEDLTLDSALHTKDGSTTGPIRSGNVQLSDKHSLALTDVTALSQESPVPIQFKGDDKMQHLRVISIQDVSGTSLLFLANNFREAELLVCGLKLLLERETARLGVRGGLPITAFGGRNKEGAMSPAAARGFREAPSNIPEENKSKTRKKTRERKIHSGYASSEAGEDSVISENENTSEDVHDQGAQQKWNRWSKQPGRAYMRGQAAAQVETEENAIDEVGIPQYAHGQLIVKEIAQRIHLPLPLPLCRVLLLDSTSAVMKKWESDRGDKNFDKTRWIFPPATPRELERHSSERQLIASGSMCGAHRTTSFDRHRYGTIVRLSETHTVEADNSKEVAFTVTERNPRRGFSLKVRIVLEAYRDDACEASVFAHVRPVGKDMSNQAAVHKAYHLVIEEISARYGISGKGLVAGFISVADEMAENNAKAARANRDPQFGRPSRRSDALEEKKNENHSITPSRKDNATGLVSFEDMLKTGRESPEVVHPKRPQTPSLQMQMPEVKHSRRVAEKVVESDRNNALVERISPAKEKKKEPVLIEVKPLPKIRLSLMPSPREEDEEESSSASPIPAKPTKKKKKPSRSSSSNYNLSTSRPPTSSRKMV